MVKKFSLKAHSKLEYTQSTVKYCAFIIVKGRSRDSHVVEKRISGKKKTPNVNALESNMNAVE